MSRKPLVAWVIRRSPRWGAEFIAALGGSMLGLLAFSFLTTENAILGPVGTVLLLLACASYALHRVARHEGSAPWGCARHFCAAFGVCFVGVSLVGAMTVSFHTSGDLGFLIFCGVSLVHALTAVRRVELGPRTRGAIDLGLAALLLPYLAFMPGRTAVQEDFNRLYHLLRDEVGTAPAALDSVHRASFVASAERLPGWREYMAESTMTAEYLMTTWSSGVGQRGAGRSTLLSYRFLATVPGAKPGDFERAPSPCVHVDLDLAVKGNLYLPGELKAVLITQELEHDHVVMDHVTALLGAFGVVPTVVVGGAE